MATVITLPTITGLDKEQCVPEGNQRLWNYFTVDHYAVLASKIFEPHMPNKNKLNLSYQKMVDRYQYLTSDGVKPQCEPLCPEGWYFDCETETCKEYRYTSRIIEEAFEILLDGIRDFITFPYTTSIGPGWYLPSKDHTGFDYSYPSIPNSWFNQPLPAGTLYLVTNGNFAGFMYPPVGSSIEDIIAFYSTGRSFRYIKDSYNEYMGGYYHRDHTFNSWDSILGSYLTKKVSPLVNQSYFLEL